MAINGIERIAERILRDAQTEAAGIQKVAEENCAKIAAQYDKQARLASVEIQEAAEKEAKEIIKRMKGEAEMKTRGVLLEEKQVLMQKAFDMAQEEILAMDEEKYRAFLVARIRMEFDEPIYAYQRLTAITYPCESRGYSFLRCYRLEKEGVTVGRAASASLIV